MKNIFHFLKAENIKEELLRILQRFQVSLVLVIVLFFGFIALIHGGLSDILSEYLVRFLLSIVIAFFLSVSAYLISEVEKHSPTQKQIAQLFPLVFGVFFYWSFGNSFESFENLVYFILTLLGILSFLFFAPFIKETYKQSGNQEIYYEYFYSMSVVFLFSCILGGVLFLLGVIAIGTVFTLFDIQYSFSDKLYGDWAAISLALFSPLFALTQIPKEKNLKKQEHIENTFFTFLIKFVVTPFILIYFVILYAYTIKVLLNFSDWPRGEVSWMVIGFSLFGYMSYIFSYSLEKKYSSIQIFRKYFPYMVLPQLAMLFYAIYLRINQYDLTINRYFVVVFGTWLACISLYLIFSRQKYLATIPALLALFTVIVSIGTWSVYQLPISRQLTRLENSLIETNILQENRIVPLLKREDISPEISGQIYDSISYICGFNDCKQIKELFVSEYEAFLVKHRADFEKNIEDSHNIKALDHHDEEMLYREPSSWELASAISDAIKVYPYYANSSVSSESQYYSFYIDSLEDFFPLSLDGYQEILRIGDRKIDGELYVQIDTEAHMLMIQKDDIILEKYALSDFYSTLKTKYASSIGGVLDKTSLRTNFSGDSYDAIVLFESITFQNPDYEKIESETQNELDLVGVGGGNAYGYVILKKKK